MRRLMRAGALAAAVTLAATLAAPSASAWGGDRAGTWELERPIQLSLGDSWAAGAVDNEEGGYVNRLYDDLRTHYDCRVIQRKWIPADCERLELVDISNGGATTESLIANQLPEAVALLAERNGDRRGWNDVEITTLTIGGNDIFQPVLAACGAGVSAENCAPTIAAEFRDYQNNLTLILGQLRAAAGPDANIVVTAYDNPLPFCSLGLAAPQLGLLGGAVLEGDDQLGLAAGLNDITRGVAAAFDVEVAETFGTIEAGEWVGGGDCLHPNGPGHEKVKDAFLDALGV